MKISRNTYAKLPFIAKGFHESVDIFAFGERNRKFDFDVFRKINIVWLQDLF